MPVQRMVNLCPYPDMGDKTSCPDHGDFTHEKHVCGWLQPSGICKKENPEELFQHAIPITEVLTIIKNRVKG